MQCAVVCIMEVPPGRDGLEGGEGTPPPPAPSRAPTIPLTATTIFNVTDSNRPQPLGQPPPTACLPASGAASEVPSLLMRACRLGWMSGRQVSWVAMGKRPGSRLNGRQGAASGSAAGMVSFTAERSVAKATTGEGGGAWPSSPAARRGRD